jgi:hypothetical protein
MVCSEEPLVVLLEAIAEGVDGPGRWPWFNSGAGVPHRYLICLSLHSG